MGASYNTAKNKTNLNTKARAARVGGPTERESESDHTGELDSRFHIHIYSHQLKYRGEIWTTLNRKRTADWDSVAMREHIKTASISTRPKGYQARNILYGAKLNRS